jgi:PTS system galactitol-specific IIC component
MTVALLMIPITLLLAIGLSFLGLNHVLPFTDLAVLPFLVIWATTWSRGNVIRGVIIATIFMAGILSVATFLAPMTVVLAKGAHFAIPKGAISISSLDSGAHMISFVLVFFFALNEVGSYGPVFLAWAALWVLFTVVCYIAYFVYCRSHVPGIDDKALYVREEAGPGELAEGGAGPIESEGAGGQAIAGQGQ